MPMVPVPDALKTVLEETAKLLWFQKQNGGGDGSCLCAQNQLVGRISAENIEAPEPGYPNHNSSIMDGYAVRTSELASARDACNSMIQRDQGEFVLDFVVIGKIYAGDEQVTSSAATNYRTAVYITTGAVVPEGFDAVIPIEETKFLETSDGLVKIQIIPNKIGSVLNTKPWTWVRTIGCDIPPGTTVLTKGEVIQPVHLALLTQVGISLQSVKVKELVRVGVLSTGNELVADVPGGMATTVSGQIPDANRPLLLAQLSTYGNCEPIDLGIVPDDIGLDVISNKLKNALWDQGVNCVDVIITTGGISMGEKDVMEHVFVEGMNGKVHFGRMNMKPGKPTTFITIDKTIDGKSYRKLAFALPGNPVSASVCTELLVRPCLDLLHRSTRRGSSAITEKKIQIEDEMETFVQWSSENAIVHEEVMATLSSAVVLDNGRPEYHRVCLKRVLDAKFRDSNEPQKYIYQATTTGAQRSSRVLSLRNADGLMLLPRGGPSGCGNDIAQEGMVYPVLLLSPLSDSMLSKPRFKDSIHCKMPILENNISHVVFKLGLIVCFSGEQPQDKNEIISKIESTIIQSINGDSQAVVLHIDTIQLDTNTLAPQLIDIVDGSAMKDVDFIFVVVATGSTAGFHAGLKLSNILDTMLLKKANALAIQLRKAAASQDSLAALFENVVGTVRRGSAVLLTCSDRGLEGAVKSISGSFRHVKSVLAQ